MRPLKGEIFPNWCKPIAEYSAQPWLSGAPQSILLIFKLSLLSLIPEPVVSLGFRQVVYARPWWVWAAEWQHLLLPDRSLEGPWGEVTAGEGGMSQGAAISTAVWWSCHMRTDLHSLPRRVRRALPGRSSRVQTGAQHMLYYGCNLLVFILTMREQ